MSFYLLFTHRCSRIKIFNFTNKSFNYIHNLNNKLTGNMKQVLNQRLVCQRHLFISELHELIFSDLFERDNFTTTHQKKKKKEKEKKIGSIIYSIWNVTILNFLHNNI